MPGVVAERALFQTISVALSGSPVVFIDREPCQIHAKYAMRDRDFLPCAAAPEANLLKRIRLAVSCAYPGVAIPAPLKNRVVRGPTGLLIVYIIYIPDRPRRVNDERRCCSDRASVP